jgi:hypothetical protein
LHAGNGARPSVRALLCKLLAEDIIPDTVLHVCLEQLLWNVRRAEAIKQAVRDLLRASV